MSVGIVIGCFIGNLLYSKRYKDSGSQIGASIINAIIIVILDVSYRLIARIMADWENHKYLQDWENSLISKNFIF